MRSPYLLALLLASTGLLQACGGAAVLDAAPRARLSSPLEVAAGVSVLLDASASFDPDGLVAAYTFSTGDARAAETLTTPELRHVYTKPGAYEVAVVVRDATGQLSRATQLVVVRDRVSACDAAHDCPLGAECRADVRLCYTAPGGTGGIAECEGDEACEAGRSCRGGLCLTPSGAFAP
jgi:hypothetical protein